MNDAPAMQFTGERFTPECPREIWYEHWHRYAFARELVAGLRVLDLACGEGYGADLLAGRAREVVGMDSSTEAIAHAARRYRRANLSFAAASAARIPVEDAQFDAVVSFETIEHLAEQAEMLREFRRVLTPSGVLIISSPDKAIYSDAVGHQNEYHVRELYRDEFLALLKEQFAAVTLLGQKLMFHSCIWPMNDGPSGGRYDEIVKAGEQLEHGRRPAPLYLIALCAAEPDQLPKLEQDLSLFGDREESVYAHYYHEIRKNMAAGAVLKERDAEIDRLRAAQAPPRASWWRRLLRRGGGS